MKKNRLKNERCPFVTCVYFASGSKCGLSTPLTSGELAAGKLVLFIALHSSSLALGKDGLSLTGGGRRHTEKRGQFEIMEETRAGRCSASGLAGLRLTTTDMLLQTATVYAFYARLAAHCRRKGFGFVFLFFREKYYFLISTKKSR